MTGYAAHAPCVICAGPVLPVCGELVHYHAARTTCSLACRNELRSRSLVERAAARLAEAVRTWRPGSATSLHAQRFSLKHETLKTALQAAGHRLAGGRVKVEVLAKEKRRRRNQPPRDFLLEALQRVYGPRAAIRQTPLPALAA